MLTEACQTLKRNRERYLAGRSTEQLVRVLSDVAEGWLKSDNTFRKLALELGPAETHFSRETLEHGLDDFFKQITRDNLNALLVQELGDVRRLDALTATDADRKSLHAATVVCAFAVRGRRETGRLPGNRRVARGKCGFGNCFVYRSRLCHCHRQR